jgi:hypothetical protein
MQGLLRLLLLAAAAATRQHLQHAEHGAAAAATCWLLPVLRLAPRLHVEHPHGAAPVAWRWARALQQQARPQRCSLRAAAAVQSGGCRMV